MRSQTDVGVARGEGQSERRGGDDDGGVFFRGGGGGGDARTLGEALQGPVRGAEVAVERVREGGVGGGDDRRGGGEGDGRGARARERRRFVAIERGARGRRRVVLPGERGRGEGSGAGENWTNPREAPRRREGCSTTRARTSRTRRGRAARGRRGTEWREPGTLIRDLERRSRRVINIGKMNPRPFKSRLQKVGLLSFRRSSTLGFEAPSFFSFRRHTMRWDLNPRPFRLRFDSATALTASASTTGLNASSLAPRTRLRTPPLSRGARGARTPLALVAVARAMSSFLTSPSLRLAPLEVSGVRQGRAQGAHPDHVIAPWRRPGAVRGEAPGAATRAPSAPSSRRPTRPDRDRAPRRRTDAEERGRGSGRGLGRGRGRGRGRAPRGSAPRARSRSVSACPTAASIIDRPRARRRGPRTRGASAARRRRRRRAPRGAPSRSSATPPVPAAAARASTLAAGGAASGGFFGSDAAVASPDGTAQRLGHAPVPAARIQTARANRRTPRGSIVRRPKKRLRRGNPRRRRGVSLGIPRTVPGEARGCG